MKELTERQMEVVGFINRFRLKEQCNPTYSEIASFFSWSSANAAFEHVVAMEKKGVVMFRPNRPSRGYVVLRNYVEFGVPARAFAEAA